MRVLRDVACLLRPLVELVFPAACVCCGVPMTPGGDRVCPRCWSSIRRVSCEDRLYRDLLSRLCQDGAMAGLVSCFYFEKEGPLQSIIHGLKYGGMPVLGTLLGARLGDAIASSIDVRTVDGVVPVPLHPARRRERGFNQAETVCEGICGVTGIPLMGHAAVRARWTASQTALDARQRQQNVEGAFAVPRGHRAGLRDARLLLVDDVITTGATIRACALTLRDAGAAEIIACSVALADR